MDHLDGGCVGYINPILASRAVLDLMMQSIELLSP